MSNKTRPNNNLKLATFAVAFAAAMGGSAAATASELQTIDKIERYCTASWRNAGIAPQDWSDCTQQALAELLERISRPQLNTAIDDSDSDARRELNRSVWRMTQRWRRSTRWLSLDEARTVPTQPADEDQAGAWEQVLSASKQCLSERQQEILSLTRQGYKAGEIADRLSISSARVSDEKYKAIARLRNTLGIA